MAAIFEGMGMALPVPSSHLPHISPPQIWYVQGTSSTPAMAEPGVGLREVSRYIYLALHDNYVHLYTILVIYLVHSERSYDPHI